jgi:crossover junction endodeoxyribonuclease RuvC
MIIAGLDPGLSGAIAILDRHGNVLLVEDTPVHTIRTGKKTHHTIDLPALRSLLTAQPIDHIVLERVAARPGQGVSSMFNFGYGADALFGLVVGLQIPCSFVTPQTWQRWARCGPSPDAARQQAGLLYPGIADRLTRKKDAGRADAILIARAGRRLLHQEKAAV